MLLFCSMCIRKQECCAKVKSVNPSTIKMCFLWSWFALTFYHTLVEGRNWQYWKSRKSENLPFADLWWFNIMHCHYANIRICTGVLYSNPAGCGQRWNKLCLLFAIQPGLQIKILLLLLVFNSLQWIPIVPCFNKRKVWQNNNKKQLFLQHCWGDFFLTAHCLHSQCHFHQQ